MQPPEPTPIAVHAPLAAAPDGSRQALVRALAQLILETCVEPAVLPSPASTERR